METPMTPPGDNEGTQLPPPVPQINLIPRREGNVEQQVKTIAQQAGTVNSLVDMVEYDLDQQYVYNRAFYGPGVTQVPEGLARNLDARKGKNWDKEIERLAKLTTAQVAINENEFVAADEMPLPEHFPSLTQLAQAGIETVGDLKGVLGELTSISGIGEASANKIIDTLKLLKSDGGA